MARISSDMQGSRGIALSSYGDPRTCGISFPMHTIRAEADMADNIMDAFLLMLDEDDEARAELDRRIIAYEGDPEDITREVLVPFAAEKGYRMTEEDVDFYNSSISDGSGAVGHLRGDDGEGATNRNI